MTRPGITIRAAFSLIELLIVLAILTVAAGFVLPNLRGPLERSRLRSSAIDIQNAWGKARTLSIREGRVLHFRCRIGGRHWKIEDSESASNSPAQNEPADFDAASSLTNDKEFPGRLLREGWLPEGVRFAELELPGQDPSESAEPGDTSNTPPSIADSAHWSRQLPFRPTGRSVDARLRLAGTDAMVVYVRIRGLTAAVSFTPPFRQRTRTEAAGDIQ